MAWRRNRPIVVQGVVLPNDFVRKCVEKHRTCPFTNPLSIHLNMVENMDHQELDAFTDPSIRPSMNPFKITFVTRGIKLRIHGFKFPLAGLDQQVMAQRAPEADFDFIFRDRAFRGYRPSWMPR